MTQTQLQQLIFCQRFIDQNPSYRHYVVTLGMYKKYQSLEQLQQYSAQILGKRSHLAVGFISMSYYFLESVNYN